MSPVTEGYDIDMEKFRLSLARGMHFVTSMNEAERIARHPSRNNSELAVLLELYNFDADDMGFSMPSRKADNG